MWRVFCAWRGLSLLTAEGVDWASSQLETAPHLESLILNFPGIVLPELTLFSSFCLNLSRFSSYYGTHGSEDGGGGGVVKQLSHFLRKYSLICALRTWARTKLEMSA